MRRHRPTRLALLLACLLAVPVRAAPPAAPKLIGFMAHDSTALFRLSGSTDQWLRLGQALDGFRLTDYAEGTLTLKHSDGTVLQLRLPDGTATGGSRARQEALAFALAAVKQLTGDTDAPLPSGIQLVHTPDLVPPEHRQYFLETQAASQRTGSIFLLELAPGRTGFHGHDVPRFPGAMPAAVRAALFPPDKVASLTAEDWDQISLQHALSTARRTILKRPAAAKP